MTNSARVYRRLQKRLDRTIFGAPESQVFTKILQLLFTPQDAAMISRLPAWLTSLEELSVELRIPEDELERQLGDMAQRGLIYDMIHNDRRYFAVAPIIFGFFEFTFMRVRDDIPVAELAKLFDRYMHESERPGHSAFAGHMQFGRALVHEEALPEDDHTEVLDWERASQIIQSATMIGVSTCACRHEASHLGEACDRPLRACLAFNYAAESLTRNGFAERITTVEAMRILQECKDCGLAQLGDSVQRQIGYICNCCGCCCLMIQAIKQLNLRQAILTSNWVMELDKERCKGCGACAQACPVDAIAMVAQAENGRTTKVPVLDESLCLGCGVCYSACTANAIRMKPREKRFLSPETYVERIVTMAVERGKLADLVFDNPQRLSYRALGTIVRVLEKSPPFKAAMAIKPLRSMFLDRVVAHARKRLGEVAEIYG